MAAEGWFDSELLASAWFADPIKGWFDESLLAQTTGPVTHDVTITEAATAGESSTRAILTDSSQTEAASAVDTPTGSSVAVAALTDAAAADESSTRASSTNSSQTEAATAGDTSTGLSLAAAEITEASTAGEVSTRVSITDSTQTEAVTASDTPNGSLVAVADLTDAASAGESSSSSVSIASESTEPVTAGESSTSASSPGAATTETVSAGDTQNGTFVKTVISKQPTADNLAFSNAYMPSGSGSLVATNFNIGMGVFFRAEKTISVKRVSVGMVVQAAGDSSKVWPSQPGTVEIWTLDANDLNANPQTKIGEVAFALSSLSPTATWHEFDFSGLTGVDLTEGNYYLAIMRCGSDWNSATTKFVSVSTGYYYESALSAQYILESNAYSLNATVPGYNPSFYSRNSFFLTFMMVQGASSVADSPQAGLTLSGSGAEAVTATDSSAAAMPIPAGQTDAAALTDAQAGVATQVASATETTSATDAQTTTLLAVAQVTEPASPGDTQAATLLTTADATEPASASDGSTSIQSKEAAQAEALALTDAAQTLLAYVASATEALAAVDLPTSTAQVQAAAQETLALLESGASTIDRFADALESATAADASDAATLLVGQLAESLALTTDTAETVTRNLFLDVSENLGGEYALTQTQAALLYQIYLLHGLAGVLEVGPTSRRNGAMQQTVSEAGGTVTVATDAAPSAAGAQVGTMVEELAALHGLTVDLEVTDSQRRAGAIVQTISEAGGVTTVTRQT